jgi:hypothetical protein
VDTVYEMRWGEFYRAGKELKDVVSAVISSLAINEMVSTRPPSARRMASDRGIDRRLDS